MQRTDTTAVLNRLLAVLHRSLPMYLSDAAVWVSPDAAEAKQLLDEILADQRMYAQRVADLLIHRRQPIGGGEFPMAYTDVQFLSLDYLVHELICYQRQDVAAIDQCVRALGADFTARALAEEILGNAKGHLESLEELERQPALA